LRKYW